MNMDCLDIGIIQAFLDGELTHDQSARVSGHIATCDACALMLADAENESSIVFPALEREFNTLVPTQRLWNKISDSITTERESRPFWHKAWAFLTVALANPSLAAAASLVIVIGIFAAVWMNRTATPAEVTPRKEIAKTIPATTVNPAPDKIEPVTPPSTSSVTIDRAAYRPDNRRIVATPAVYPVPNTNSNGYMPGEESYVKTISTLSKTVAEQKDGVMRPSERIAYESDMAIVNDTIDKMKKEVKKNPKNESAKQVLYSSYQNKIDLLNSVAQKEELVASLR
ncbi:MAG: zf-HC2 domain-containing protein, partial [Acidobacteriota bacterium]